MNGQYDRPPAEGLTRSWISWRDYGPPEWPDPLPPWRMWLSGNGDDARGPFVNICALMDAPDEATAWAEVARYFPDYERRFCTTANDKTLGTLAAGERFA